MNIQNLVLDINKKPFQTITANVGEVASRFVKISIVDKSIPVDLTGVTVSIYAKKPDGKKVFNNVTIEDKTNGIILAELTSQILAVEGLVKLTLLLVKNGSKLCSKQFLLNVDSTIVDDTAIESTNEFTALTTALGKVNNIDSRFESINSSLDSMESLKATKQEVDIERKRIDSFTKLSEGSTTGDAELIDGRVGYNGTVYENIGDSIRGQLKDVHDLFKINYSSNIADFNWLNPNTSYPSNFKNRCKIEVIENGIKLSSVTNDTIGSTYVRYTLPIEEYANKKLYFKCNVNVNGTLTPRFACRYLKTDGTLISNVASATSEMLEFTVPDLETITSNNYTHLAFEFYLTNGTVTTSSNDYVEYTNIQLEVDVLNEYTPAKTYSFFNDFNTLQINELQEKTNKMQKTISNLQLNNKTLKVMTFNIGKFNYGKSTGGMEQILVDEKMYNWRRFLGEHNVDVLAVQEFCSTIDADGTLDSNSNLFNYLFANYTSHYPQQLKIYSKEMLQENSVEDYLPNSTDANKRGIVKSYITLDNGVKICLINCHLTYFDNSDGVEIRNQQINSLLNILKDEEYFILFGDFNANFGGISEYNPFIEKGYNLANGGYFGWVRTFNNEKNYTDTANKGHDRFLDNIITSANIKIINAKVLNTFDYLTSDHLPILAEIEIN